MRRIIRVALVIALALAVLDFLLEGLGLNAYVSLGITAAALLLGQLWRPERAVPMSIPAFGLCLVSAIRLDRRGADTTLAGLCALFVLLCYLLFMHEQGLQEGLHNMPGEQPMVWPRGIRWKNAVILVLFFVLVLGLASIGIAERGIDRLWHVSVTWVEKTCETITADIRKRAMAPPTPPPPETPEPEEEDEGYETYYPSPIIAVFFLPVILLSMVFVVAVLMLLPGQMKKMISRVRERRRRRGLAAEDELYEEELEKLRDWHDLLLAARKKLRPKPKAPRKRRWQDLPDDRARVRYAWFHLQYSPAGKKQGPGLTPKELGTALGAEYLALAEQYNLARYAPGKPLSPNAGDLAAAAMRRIKKLR